MFIAQVENTTRQLSLFLLTFESLVKTGRNNFLCWMDQAKPKRKLTLDQVCLTSLFTSPFLLLSEWNRLGIFSQLSVTIIVNIVGLISCKLICLWLSRGAFGDSRTQLRILPTVHERFSKKILLIAAMYFCHVGVLPLLLFLISYLNELGGFCFLIGSLPFHRVQEASWTYVSLKSVLDILVKIIMHMFLCMML